MCLLYILQNLLKCWVESVGGVLTALWRSLNVLLIRVPLQRAGVEVPRWKYSNYASRSSGGGGEDWPDLQNQIRGIENVVGRKRRASNWGEVQFLKRSENCRWKQRQPSFFKICLNSNVKSLQQSSLQRHFDSKKGQANLIMEVWRGA